MQQLYPLFYKQHGVRRLQNLLAPKLSVLTSLPKDAMLHYVSDDETHLDVDTSKLYLASSKRILLDCPSVMTGSKGNPQKKNILIKPLLRDFLIKNKKYRYLADHYQHVNDQLTLFINNYSYLNVVYRYVDFPLTPYYKWWNNHRTMYDAISKIANETEKHHFVCVELPEDLPSYAFLNTYSKVVNVGMMKVFDTPSKLMLLEVWKWLSNVNRKDTIFGSFHQENQEDDKVLEQYHKVNLVFTSKDGRSAVINLGYLNSWIKDNKNTTEFSNITQQKADVIQKLFLKFLMTMHSTAPEEVIDESLTPTDDSAVDPADAQKIADLKEAQDEYEEVHSDDDDDSNYEDALSGLMKIQTPTKVSAQELTANITEKGLDEVLLDNLSFDKQLLAIDDEIKLLNSISDKKMKEKGFMVSSTGDVKEEDIQAEDTPVEVIRDKIYKSETYEEVLRREISRQADYGLLSASDYKRFLNDIDNYKNLPDPYGRGKKLVEEMIITQADLQLDNVKTQIVASGNVIDKSMLNSSLQSFDRDYVNNVIHKDMLSMLSGLQKTGVVIRRHDIDTDHSVMGSYEMHTLELKPIDGASSTIRFKVPKISDDGTFVSSGNKYVLRKQRVD